MRPLLVSLLAAADAAPTDVTLRLHVVELLREHGEFVEAVRHCATALAVDPSAVPVRTMMRELLGEAPPPLDRGTPPSSEATVPHPAAAPVPGSQAAAVVTAAGLDGAHIVARAATPSSQESPDARGTFSTSSVLRGRTGESGPDRSRGDQGEDGPAVMGVGDARDGRARDSDVHVDEVPNAPVRTTDSQDASTARHAPGPHEPRQHDLRQHGPAGGGEGPGREEGDEPDERWAERVNVTLADIGGMDTAKERLQAAVLAPMRNPELRRLYRQSRTGGVLLYGPPGCGKTFLARATAGELDSRFLSVTFEGRTPAEQVQEIAAVFQAARDQAPVVLCLVGVEHLGGPRAADRRGATPRAVGALTAELDKGPEGNLGVTVMGTTNAPWEVDPALRRPGRLEQSLLVLPPDRTTREVVLHQQLGDHPEVDIPQVARRSRGYSGRDLVSGIRGAESRTGGVVTTKDVLDALAERPPSAQRWLEAAANQTAVIADDTSYVGLREYLAARRVGPATPSSPPGAPTRSDDVGSRASGR